MFVNRVRALVAGIVCGLTSMVVAQVPVGTAFTYQGELRQAGAVVTSSADMRFRLYDSATGGNQIGPELQLLSGTVNKGHFTVELDFGATAFGPNARWLEVVLRTPAGPGAAYTTLTPRQRISAAPVAMFALSGNAGAAGPTGPIGPQGFQGPPGVQGQTGSQGVAGPGGPAGPAGPQGVMGPTGLPGSQGSTGAAGLLWRGVWSPQSNYALNDAILDNGSSYRCIAAPNVGNPPATSPGLWQLVASVGSPGVTGATGPVGAQGSTGLQGPQGAQGAQGVPGPTGSVGPSGAPGQVGNQGPPGIPGAPGATGAAGSPGASFTQFVVGLDPADPYHTVQSAVVAAQLAGGPQLVFVKPGLYQENVFITGPDITLRGSGVSSTVVAGTLRVSPSPNSAGRRVSKIDSFTIKTSVENGVTVTSPGPVDVSFSEFTVDTTGPIVTCMLVDCPSGGQVSLRQCTCTSGYHVSGASLSMDALDCAFSGVQCESSRLRLSNCLITSVSLPALSLSSGAQCECVSSWMGRSSTSGTPSPDCAVVSSGSSLTCRSCVTVGRFACDSSSLRLESCDSSNPSGVCCDLSGGATCVATSSRLSGGGGGAGGSVCVSVAPSCSMTCTGSECTGQFDCVGGAMSLTSCSIRDYDSDDDGVCDIRSGGTCELVSCVIDSGRATGGRCAVSVAGASSRLEMSGSTCFGSLECSAVVSTTVLKSFFQTGDRPTSQQRNGAHVSFSGCSFVRSPGALTNGVCMSLDGQDTDTDCSSCELSGSVALTGGSRVSFHSSSITTLSLPCLSEVSSAAELDFCTLSSGGVATDGRCVVASGGHVSLSRCELYGGEQCDDGATVTNDGCTIRCVAAPCVTVSPTSHALLHSGAMLTSSSPAVASAQGGEVRFGVMTYLGSGGGMPPTAVALPVENVAQLVTVQVQQFSGPVSMVNPSNVFGGNGAALSSLSASSLSSGTVPDARLSTSVVRTNAPNVFSLDQTFTQTMHALGGVQFSDGSVQQTAALPPLSKFTVGKDPGDAFSSVQAAVSAAEAAGGAQVVVLKSGTFAGDVTITSPDITLWGVSGHGASPSTILGQLRFSGQMSVGKPMLTWCVRVQVDDNRPAVVVDCPSPVSMELRDVVVTSTAPVTGPLMLVSPSSSTGGGGSGRVAMSSCTVSGRLYMVGGAELSFVGVDDDCDSITCEGASVQMSSSRFSCTRGVCVDALSGARVSLSSCSLVASSSPVAVASQVVRLDATSSVSCASCECTGELLCVGGSLRLTGGTYNDPDTDGDSLVAVTQGGRVTAVSACFRDAAGNTSPVFSVSSGSTCSISCCPTCRIDNSPTDRPVALCDGAGSSCEISGSPCVGSLVCTGGGQCVARASSFVTNGGPALHVTSSRCILQGSRFSSSPTGALTDAVCMLFDGADSDCDGFDCDVMGQCSAIETRSILKTFFVRTLSQPALHLVGGTEECDDCNFVCGSGAPTDALCVSVAGGASLRMAHSMVVGREQCDDGNASHDDCVMRCVSSPCVSVGASGHVALRTCTLQTSASPLVAIVQGAEVRYGLVTSGGSGSGMPPGSVALVIQNLPMLTTPDLQSFSGPLSMSNPSNVLGGNGAALTSLDASHITTGVLDDSHFPSSVVRTTAPNVFSAENTFTQAVHAEGGVAFADGSLQTSAARPPLSRFTVGKDPGDAFSSVQAAVDAAQAAGGPQVVMVKPGVYAGDVLVTGPDITLRGASSAPDQASTIAGQLVIQPGPNAAGARQTWCFGLRVTDSAGLPAVVVSGPGPVIIELGDLTLDRSVPSTSPLLVVAPTSSTGGGGAGSLTVHKGNIKGAIVINSSSSLRVRLQDSDADSVACDGAALTLDSCRLTCPSGVALQLTGGATCAASKADVGAVRSGVLQVALAAHVGPGCKLDLAGGTMTGQVVVAGGELRSTGTNYLDDDSDDDGALSVSGGGIVVAHSGYLLDALDRPVSDRPMVHCVGQGSRVEMTGMKCGGSVVATSGGAVFAHGCQVSTVSSPCLAVVGGGAYCWGSTFVVGSGGRTDLVCVSSSGAASSLEMDGCTITGRYTADSSICTARSCTIESLSLPCVELSHSRASFLGCRLTASPSPLTDAVCIQLSGTDSDCDFTNCAVTGALSCASAGRTRNKMSSFNSLSLPALRITDTDVDCDSCVFACGAGASSDATCIFVSGPLARLSLQQCRIVGGETCDDGGTSTSDGCSFDCVSSPCVVVSSSSHAELRGVSLSTSASPAVSSAQGGDVRFGVVTYTGSGRGMPPFAVALAIENLPMLTSPSLQSFSGPLAMTNPSNVLGGNGAALTSLDASHITTGVLDDSHFPSSVVRTTAPNVFSAENSFTQAVHAEGGVAFADGSLQTTAARPPLSRFTVGKDPGDAFSSIQAAVDAAELAGGGTVFVKPGVYSEDVTITKSNVVVTSSSSRDNRSYVAGRFHIEVDGASVGSGRVVVQGLEIVPLSGPAMVLAGQSLCEVVVSDCKLTCASGTCMSVDLQGVDTSGRHTPFHVSRCTISSSAGQAAALALLSGEGRLAECRVSCPVDGVAMSCALGAATKQYVDSCDFSGRVQCAGSGACVMTRCSVSLPASSQTDSVAFALSGSCAMSCRDCTVSGGRVDSSGSSRLDMTGGKVLVVGGLDAVRLTVQARDRFDNVQMSGRLFVTDGSECDLSRCTVSVSSGDAVSGDSSCRITFNECFLTGRVASGGSCVCVIRDSSMSVSSGDCLTASGSSRVSVRGNIASGVIRALGAASCEGSGGSVSNPGGDCLVCAEQGTIRFTGTDFHGRVFVTDSSSFSLSSCTFDNGQALCMVADEDCDGDCLDCDFSSAVSSTGTRQKTWTASNFRFSGDCMVISEECDDKCADCTFDGRVVLSGNARSTFTTCAFAKPGQCVSMTDHHQSSFISCRKSGQVTCGDFTRVSMQGCTFSSSLQCLAIGTFSDGTIRDCTFAGPVSSTGRSSVFSSCAFTSPAMCLVLDSDNDTCDDCSFTGSVSCPGDGQVRLSSCTFLQTSGVALAVGGTTHCQCSHLRFTATATFSDGSSADITNSEMRCPSGSCVVMSDTASVSLIQSVLESPVGVSVVQAPATTTLRVAQLVLPSQSLVSGLPLHATAVTVADPIDSSRIVDGSVSSSDLALDSSSLARVSGGSLQASSSPAGSSIVLSSSSVFLFGGQDVSLSRAGPALLHVEGDLESSRGIQARTGDFVASAGRVLTSDGAVFGGGGGGGGSGGQMVVSSTGDVTTDGGLSVAGAKVVTDRDTGRTRISSAPSTSMLTVGGEVRSTSGGFVFPDSSVQTTAATSLSAGGGLVLSSSVLSLASDPSSLALVSGGVMQSSGGSVFMGTPSGTSAARLSIGINEPLPMAALQLSVSSPNGDHAAVVQSSSLASSALYVESVSPGSSAPAIQGVSRSLSQQAAGVHGRNDALFGPAVGVLGESHSQQGFGVFSVGNTGATGLKSFYIDHPLDPANKFLRHYSAEGPEALNIYRGTVVLNAAGEAAVSLPDYFEALNKDFDYQLTCVGGFAPVFIAEEVRNNVFKISGGRAGLKVCWTVTGVRNDAFARNSTPPVEEAKPAELRGRYLHPELFNTPRDKAIFLNVEPAAGGVAQTRKN